MRQPNNIILDLSNKNTLNYGNYWIFSFLKNSNSNFNYINNNYLLKNIINSNKIYINFLFNKLSYLNKNTVIFNSDKKIKNFISSLYSIANGNININFLYNIININYIRKERLYTKLKYSRSPAYDSVSGGSAALLGGLLVYLVAEKYGIELVDSGDFYYLIMYVGFLIFSFKPFLVITSYNVSLGSVFSLKRVFKFYSNILFIFLKLMK